MKKFLIATALVAASASAANAYVGINLDFSEPAPVYAAPAPVYYAPPPQPIYAAPVVVEPGYRSGRWRHRDYDWNYWNHRPAPHPVPHGGPGWHR